MPAKKPVKNVGIAGIAIPKESCEDPNCPFHGTIKVRGQVLEGVVVSDKMEGTVVVRRDYLFYDRKYRRYEWRKSLIHAHNPPCISAKQGDTVIIGETRPISKTVKFVVIGKKEGAEVG